MTPSTDNATVLIVDDTPSNLGVVVGLLEGSGYRVAIAQDGEEGLQRAALVLPDLILLDVMMPGLDGFEVCRRLKAQPATSGIPVIFMTALTDVGHKVAGFKAGGVDYVTKPLQTEEVAARVETHLKLRAMQRRLEEQNAQLAKHGEELERRVAERTAELTESNRQLRESERQFRALAENAPDVIVRYDREGRRIYVNPEFERVNGLTARQVLGKKPVELSTELAPMAAYFTARLMAAMESATTARIDLDWTRDGKPICWFVRVVPEFDGDGNVISALTIWSDISERKAMEEALRASEQEFRSLAENSPDIIVRYDRDCRRRYVNPAYVRETDLSAETVLGTTSVEVSLQLDIAPAAYMDRLRRVMETGASEEMTVSWARVGKVARVNFAMRIVAEHGADGRAIGALAIGRNITALVEAERRLEESRAQLRALATRREAAREDERHRIALELHDELGQQLSALRIGVNLLDFQFGKELPGLREPVANLRALVDQTIQVTRDVASSLRPAVLDMGIVPALEWLAAELSRRTGIPCELKAPPEDVRMDAEQAVAVFRIVQESLTNAARHAQAEHIDIVFDCEPAAYVIEIKDDGVGFDANGPGKLQSFGLVGIRERVLAVDGEVVFSSAPERGTAVRVRMPMARRREGES